MQNLLVVNVPTLNADALAKELDAIGLKVGGSSFWRGTVACSGTEFCKLAITETKGFSRWLVEELEERLPGFDQHLKLHVTGCPNSCGQHWIADIGIEGKKIKVNDRWSMPTTSAWAARLACIRQQLVRLDIAAWPPKFRMRSSACSDSIWQQREPGENLRRFFARHSETRIARVSGRRSRCCRSS